MKKNKGFTLVELIVVAACLGLVTMFFWSILNSTSEDSYNINDKIAVQTNVTALMNVIQQDIQESKIIQLSENKKGILEADYTNNVYNFSNVTYTFDKSNRVVTRSKGDEVGKYNDISDFVMEAIEGEKYGAKVEIVGGKKAVDEFDKSRYTLSTTYYTRNTQ